MKTGFKIGFIVAVSVLAGIGGSWLFLGGSSIDADSSDANSEQHLDKHVRSESGKKISERNFYRRGDKKSISIVESDTNKPDMHKDAEIDDIELLSDIQKAILKEIQDALGADDLKSLRKAIAKFSLSPKNGGLGGYQNVPRVMRSAAVQALGWFKGGAAIDLIDFMADMDESVSSEAFDQFESAIQDMDLSDYERSAIIKATAKALTDPESADMLASSLFDMRNSVKGETAIALLTNGSDQVKAATLDQLDFYFNDDVKTVDDIKKWMEENPDDPDDDDFYGGSKD